MDPGGRLGLILFPGAIYRQDQGAPPESPIGSFFVGPPSFDSAFSKWVPVRPQAVSPDGSKYVYASGPDLHIVDVATGLDRVLLASAAPATGPGFIIVLEFSISAIYLTAAKNDESQTSGLWVVNPITGAERQAGSGSGYSLMSGSRVWIESTRQQLQLPAGPSPDTVTLLDLSSNRTSPWVFNPGDWLSIDALDGAGFPIVNVYGPNSPGYRAYDAPGTGTQITNRYVDSPQGDDHGIWFAGRDGLYLWTDRGGLVRVTDVRLVPLGPCI
jgi:hypothetical protein